MCLAGLGNRSCRAGCSTPELTTQNAMYGLISPQVKIPYRLQFQGNREMTPHTPVYTGMLQLQSQNLDKHLSNQSIKMHLFADNPLEHHGPHIKHIFINPEINVIYITNIRRLEILRLEH